MPVWVIPLIMVAGSIVKSLIESNAADDASNALNDGFNNATNLIKDATSKSFQYLDPYLKGGQQDYNDFRQLAKGGYYDTPAPISYQPQAYQNQGVSPTGFDPATMSFGNSYQPMQFQQMGLLSSLPLPDSHLGLPQPGPTTPPGASLPPLRTPQQVLIDSMNKVPHPDLVTPPSSLSPVPVYNPQTGDNSPIKEFKPVDPRRPSLADFIEMMKKNPVIKGQSGPYGLMSTPGGLR